VSALGLGTMGMSRGYYGPSDDDSNVATIHRAIELGVSLIDTADVYGDGHNETPVGRVLAGRRDRVTLATKTGLVQSDEGLSVDARPERIRRALHESLGRLGVERVDLYYLHRVDPRVPVEESIGAMADLVAERSPSLGDDDLRSRLPRFQGANLESNLPIADRVAEVAARRGATPAQVALAWLLDRGPEVIPIPGTRRRENLEANVAAAALELDDDDRALLDDPALAPAGDRYPAALMDLLDPEVRRPS
jgi:aryl-alcohol dehydrogenase-like predicted oxidoreductase